MTNSIGGDFNQDAVESFRKAYGERLIQPEDQESEDAYGMRTNIVPNTSPWIAYTGLWKANDGMSRNFVPNTPLTAPTIVEDTYEEDSDLNITTEEEIDAIMAKILGNREPVKDDWEDEGEDEDEDELDPEENEVLQDPELRELSLGRSSSESENEDYGDEDDSEEDE